MKKRMEEARGPVSVESVVWKRTLRWEGESVLSLSLRRPSLPEHEGAGPRRVERYYRALAAQWRSRWEAGLYRAACTAAADSRAKSCPFRPWEASLDYTVTLRRDGLLSLYLEARERTGEGRSATVRCGDTWEPATGTVRTLRSFFPPNTRWKRLLLLDAQAQARIRLAAGETLLFDDWQPRMERAFSPERFYLTEAGLCLFYPLYAIAPYAEGIPVFTLPLPAPAEDGHRVRSQ